MKLYCAISLALILAVLAVAAGCGTVQGLGKDIQTSGEFIEDAAK